MNVAESYGDRAISLDNHQTRPHTHLEPTWGLRIAQNASVWLCMHNLHMWWKRELQSQYGEAVAMVEP